MVPSTCINIRCPDRAIKELHRDAAADLGVDDDAKDEMEILLSELQQLLVGISIMQVEGLYDHDPVPAAHDHHYAVQHFRISDLYLCQKDQKCVTAAMPLPVGL